MSAHSLLIQCACELFRVKISFSVRSSCGSRKERGKKNRPAGVITLYNRFWVKAAGRTNWGKLEAAYVAVPFPPFNFRNGQDLIVRPVVIAVISVALEQTRPGSQWFVVSSIRTGPEIKSHLPCTSRGKPALSLSSRLPVKVKAPMR